MRNQISKPNVGLKSSVCDMTGTFFFSDRLWLNETVFGPQRSEHSRATWQPFSQNAARLFMSSSALIHAAIRLLLHHFLFESPQVLIFEIPPSFFLAQHFCTTGTFVADHFDFGLVCITTGGVRPGVWALNTDCFVLDSLSLYVQCH